MPTRRKLILGSMAWGSAALLAACGKAQAPPGGDANASIGGGDSTRPPPLAISVPASPAFALAMIAQQRGLWRDMYAALALANDDATLVRGFNSGLVAIGGLTLERFLFWHSGGTPIQLIGWASHEADVGKSGVYVARGNLPGQDGVIAHVVNGLRAAEAWTAANPAEAAALVGGQIGAPVDAASLPNLLVGAQANRGLLAPGPDGESPSLKTMRPLDEAMRNKDQAGHVAFLPDIIAPSAAAAWMG